MLRPFDYESVGRFLSRLHPGEIEGWINREADKGYFSRATAYRALSFYRLFVLALGFDSEVFRLGPRVLMHLREQIDWDARTGEVGGGLGAKWSKRQARQAVRELLRDLDP